MSAIRVRRRGLAPLWRLDGFADDHGLLYRESLEPYAERARRHGGDLGSVLALGACHREVEWLRALPFRAITLSGIAEPDEATLRAERRDPRVRYELADVQALP